LITGASGSGKSSLALELMAFGAVLVADDRVCLQRVGEAVLASPPPATRGLIEARFVGLLRAPWAPAPVLAVLDLDRVEAARLPEPRLIRLLGCDLPLLLRPGHAPFAAAMLQFLKAGSGGQ
jgi:HPr kinase/phosphorylase